jgi:hypothetical protein
MTAGCCLVPSLAKLISSLGIVVGGGRGNPAPHPNISYDWNRAPVEALDAIGRSIDGVDHERALEWVDLAREAPWPLNVFVRCSR